MRICICYQCMGCFRHSPAAASRPRAAADSNTTDLDAQRLQCPAHAQGNTATHATDQPGQHAQHH